MAVCDGTSEVPPTSASADQHRLNCVQALVQSSSLSSLPTTLRKNYTNLVIIYIPITVCFYAYFRSQSFILFDDFSVNEGVWDAVHYSIQILIHTHRWYPTSHYIILKLTRGVFIVCLFYINFTRFYPVSVDAIISTHIFCTVTPIDLFLLGWY